jgi:hypothetical protein
MSRSKIVTVVAAAINSFKGQAYEEQRGVPVLSLHDWPEWAGGGDLAGDILPLITEAGEVVLVKTARSG